MDPAYSNLDQLISQNSKNAVFVASAILILLTAISLKIKHKNANLKKMLFWGFVTVTVACTIFLAASTIYLNSTSQSRGPVHHHADFEIWKCQQELELKDPKGFSNKIGTATLHEHNDKRIHIEGVIVKPQDASLGKFFDVVGGNLEKDSLSIPTNQGQTILKSGTVCPNTASPKLQVFLYKVQAKFYSQVKLKDPQNYIISSETNVPPGDCIVIEFDQEKARTDKLCRSFEVAIQTGKLKGELKF